MDGIFLIVEKDDRIICANFCSCGCAHVVDMSRKMVLILQGPGAHEIFGPEEDLELIQFVTESGIIQ